MFTNKEKKVPLQRYWTSHYVITLAIGLIAVAIVSAFWIRHTTFENRLNMMKLMAQQTADQIVRNETGIGDDGSTLHNFNIRKFLNEPGKYMQMPSDPSIYLVNASGEILYSNRKIELFNHQLNPSVLYTDEEMATFYLQEKRDKLYMVKKPIEVNQTIIGWVVFLELKGNLTAVEQEYKQLSIMIGALALLGWVAIYLLSKRLARPITEVAAAAEKVKEGNYAFELPENIPEKEVHELIHSFKEMSEKLQHLETLRTELLAGVTHELKTPVTSISGLIQAVKDGVVEGKEAEEFLEISIEETKKMKRMVEDLLAFNTFVANAVPLNLEKYNMHELMKDVIRHWQVMTESNVNVNFHTVSEKITVRVDDIRFQQIMTNLFNNAKDATIDIENPEMTIRMFSNKENVWIDVADNGTGIPEEEQHFVFERFYRGEQKKLAISGFGLGLPFSKMIAQALGGDLVLLKSSDAGTIFRIFLPIYEIE